LVFNPENLEDINYENGIDQVQEEPHVFDENEFLDEFFDFEKYVADNSQVEEDNHATQAQIARDWSMADVLRSVGNV